MIVRPRCPKCYCELPASVVFDYLKELRNACSVLRAELAEHDTMVSSEERAELYTGLQ